MRPASSFLFIQLSNSRALTITYGRPRDNGGRKILKKCVAFSKNIRYNNARYRGMAQFG